MAVKQQNSQELETIEILREKSGTPQAVYQGVCARQNWRPGQQITGEAYEKALREFLCAPLGRSSKK